MKLRWKILLGVTAAIGLALLLPMGAHYRAKASVAAYKRQLKAQGEKLTISELIPPTPTNGPNGAQALLSAGSRLSVNISNYAPMMTIISPGHARAAWKQEVLPTEDLPNVWPDLIKELESQQDALSGARTALASPVLDF